MSKDAYPGGTIDGLKQRANELNCLYRIMEILKEPRKSIKYVCTSIIENIIRGLNTPERFRIKITLNNEVFHSRDFTESEWYTDFPIITGDKIIGGITVYYVGEKSQIGPRTLSDAESRLVKTVAGHVGTYLADTTADISYNRDDWQILFNMLRNTNRELYYRICRKLLTVINWEGHDEAVSVMRSINRDLNYHRDHHNRFRKIHSIGPDEYVSDDFDQKLVKLVQANLRGDIVLKLIQRWIQEEKLGLLAQIGNRNLSIEEVAQALKRYFDAMPEEFREYSPTKWGIQVSLIRKFLSEQTDYIDRAKNLVDIRDFHELLNNLVYTKESRGKLGGKGAMLFLLDKALKKRGLHEGGLSGVKTPKTWYISSDIIYHFMGYNDFEDVIEQKYKDSGQIRMEYPNIVQAFKNGQFPEDIIKILSTTLDDFGDVPLMVRSSSLLEGQLGSGFYGMYPHVFLANRGSKTERLEALKNAIATIYASIFAPEPLEYRSRHRMLDSYEEMGIVIQEVIGEQVGEYFMPLFSGVASSENEFIWAPHIKRKDGLLCMVPGLWVPLLSRLKDDYLILFPLTLSGEKSADSIENARQLLPKNMCVFNMESGCLEAVKTEDLLKNAGLDFTEFGADIFPSDSSPDSALHAACDSPDSRFISLKRLQENSQLLTQANAILEILEKEFGAPVRIEFAFRRNELYITNCRIENRTQEPERIPVPKDIPDENVLFSVGRNTRNGIVESITHIVYIDPARYVDLPDLPVKKQIGTVIGRLNKLLPKKKYILMGPWKWAGSRSLHHGVEIVMSDVNCAAAIIDIPLRAIPCNPEYSYETYLFQDLMKAEIHHLMLCPDQENDFINRSFLKKSNNMLSDIVSDCSDLNDIVKLIDIPGNTDGRVLKLTMNGDLNEAMAYFTIPPVSTRTAGPVIDKIIPKQDSYWRWRLNMAEHIASRLDAERFGVKNIYVFGSTKNATAGPCSDIDILVHFGGTQEQLRRLKSWMEGWSLCLDEMNYLKTGYRSDGLLDVQYITDEDIINKTCFASMIGAITDPARPLKLNK